MFLGHKHPALFDIIPVSAGIVLDILLSFCYTICSSNPEGDQYGHLECYVPEL